MAFIDLLDRYVLRDPLWKATLDFPVGRTALSLPLLPLALDGRKESLFGPPSPESCNCASVCFITWMGIANIIALGSLEHVYLMPGVLPRAAGQALSSFVPLPVLHRPETPRRLPGRSLPPTQSAPFLSWPSVPPSKPVRRRPCLADCGRWSQANTRSVRFF